MQPYVGDVFVLGAGFSMAVSNVMPSTDELGARALRLLRALHNARVHAHSDKCDGISCDEPQLVDNEPPAPNFEIWLSRLAEAQPYLFDAVNDRRRALYRDLSGALASEVEQATVEACEQVIPSPDW